VERGLEEERCVDVGERRGGGGQRREEKRRRKEKKRKEEKSVAWRRSATLCRRKKRRRRTEERREEEISGSEFMKLRNQLRNSGIFLLSGSVDNPDVKGRTEILKVHASNKKFEPNVSLEVVAMRTLGFNGADLANLLNEGAILAGGRGKTAI
jgi:hypothetical protein